MTTQHLGVDKPVAGAEVTRFAPSPTGLLHLGHVAAALVAWETARICGGRFLLRMEDIDRARCRPEFEAAIIEDLRWLGLDWDEPVVRQSERAEAHGRALARLRALGLVYGCCCTRGDIAAAVAAPHGAVALYPGTCRGLGLDGDGVAWRLDVARAGALAGSLTFADGAALCAVEPGRLGDFVVARRGLGVAYHLAVVVDDADMGVTLVTRGEDLAEACHGQRLLQAVLGLPAVRYRHHGLLRDADGRRLAKRDRAATVAAMRAAGMTPADVLARARAGLAGAAW